MKKNDPYIINIPQPCHEGWENMTPVDKGRFCGSCQKTVIDFTLMSDQAIMDVLKKHKGQQTCGHFHVSQINRELIPKKSFPLFSSDFIKKIAASLLLFQSVVHHAWGQAPKKHATEINKPDAPVIPSFTHKVVRGKVVSQTSDEPLAGATITVEGTSIKTLSDKRGKFSFSVLDTMHLSLITINVAYMQQGAPVDYIEIPGKQVFIDTLIDEDEIVLYWRPAEDIDPVAVVAYKRAYIDGGAMNRDIVVGTDVSLIKPKQTFFRRVKNFFTFKKKHEE